MSDNTGGCCQLHTPVFLSAACHLFVRLVSYNGVCMCNGRDSGEDICIHCIVAAKHRSGVIGGFSWVRFGLLVYDNFIIYISCWYISNNLQ